MSRDVTVHRHYKGGLYKIIDNEVYHTETNERMVVYVSLKNGVTYVRPYKMFYETIDVPYGTMGKTMKVQRFKEERLEGVING